MRSEHPYQPSRGRRFAQRVFGLLIVLDVASALALWLHGPLKIEASALPFGLRFPPPQLVLPALVAVWCALGWRDWRRWLGLRPTHVLNWRGVPFSAWLVMPLSVGLLAAQIHELPRHAASVTHKVRRSESKAPGDMSLSSSNRHVTPLVRRLVQRKRADPVVVWLEDWDRRGHIAAFYLYPRLMLMEPSLRRFTLRRRMASERGKDPYFFVGPGPPMSRSREFAQERGAEFIFAGRHGEREPGR